MTWIPVSDRLPAKETHCPVIHSHALASGHVVRKVWYASYDPRDGLWHDLWDDDDTRWSEVVTHWFELPSLEVTE